MAPSLKLQTRVATITLALMFTAVAVHAQSGISSAAGLVADETATRQGKFVVITGAKVELEQNVKNSPRKFTSTTDKLGKYEALFPDSRNANEVDDCVLKSQPVPRLSSEKPIVALRVCGRLYIC